MCGILGIWKRTACPAQDGFQLWLSTLAHRGPDAQWYDQWRGFSLGSTRLAIVNGDRTLEECNGASPDLIVLLNGEIWNSHDLAQEVGLSTNATEYDIIRALYKRDGELCATRFNGIFVICILDKNRKRLFIFRDPWGVKPCFYFLDQLAGQFVFASDLKTIAQWDGIAPRVNLRFVANEHIFGFSDYQDTLIEDIHQLPPASYLIAQEKNGELSVSESSYKFRPSSCTLTEPLWKTQLGLLERAVWSQYAHTDHYPIGLLLSGGIDSSLLAFVACSLGLRNIKCFHIGIEGTADHYWAEIVARKTGYQLERVELQESSGFSELPSECYYMSGMHSALFGVLRNLKRLHSGIRVLWTGEGSDELYGGYRYYSDPGSWVRSVADRALAAHCETELIGRFWQMFPKAHHGVAQREELLEFLEKEQLVNNHLVPLDYASMASSMELRLPFLDLENTAFIRGLPQTERIVMQQQKQVLKAVLMKLSGIEENAFYDRPKRGLLHAFVSGSAYRRERCARMFCQLTGASLRPYRIFMKGPFQALWYEIIERVFVDLHGCNPTFSTEEFLR
jgi:asparagine synthase (glutamine-hydrolysing)